MEGKLKMSIGKHSPHQAVGKLNLGVPLVFCVKLQIPALINVNLLNYSLNAGIEQYVVYSQL